MGRPDIDPENPSPKVNYRGFDPHQQQQQQPPPVIHNVANPTYPTPQPAAIHIQPVPPAPPQEEPLLCNGLGLGWLLFIIGFFTGIPWYVGAVLLFCGKDKREKPGFIACLVLAVLCTVAIIINVAVAATASASTSSYSYYSPPSYYYYYSPPSYDYSYFFPSPPPPGQK